MNEVIRDLMIVWGPFLIGCPVMMAMENREKKKAAQKRFEEIKRKNRMRKVNEFKGNK